MEILATIPIYTHPWFYNLLFAIAVVIIGVGITSILMTSEFKSATPLFIGLALMIIGILGIFHTSDAMERTSTFDYNKYKVTIDETVNAKEFLNQYEILSREGEIFTIKEIEVDE